MKHWFLYLLVFIAGAAVLAVEMLGTRILGPFYGVNIFLWSALISVTLIALSIGYFLGGRWADRGASMMRLCYLLVGAGIWLLAIPWLKQPLLSLGDLLGLRMAVLTAAFLLFAPPLALLGMVSPYAVKLRVSSLGTVGQTAGDLYAISTIGSVLSALLTGFILIPAMGISMLTVLTGITLLVCAIAGMLLHNRSRLSWLTSGSVGMGSLVILLAVPAETSLSEDDGLVLVEQSLYGEIRVSDHANHRYLLIDGTVHTITNTFNWKTLVPYVAVTDIARQFFQQPGEALFIGLGGGSMLKSFSEDGWKNTAVEIDPAIVRIARAYFNLQAKDGEIFCQDGRQFLLQHPEKYELIVMDVYGSGFIPSHLITWEAFGLMADHLSPEGVLAINVTASGWEDRIMRSLTTTLKTHFTEILALPVHPAPNRVGNIILLAANRPLELSNGVVQPKVHRRLYPKSMAARRDRAWQYRYEPSTEGAVILTDDRNPAEVWAMPLNDQSREKLQIIFDEEGRWIPEELREMPERNTGGLQIRQ